jgi:hypothetical protein
LFCFIFFKTGFFCVAIDQAGLELRNLPASQVLRLKACVTTARHWIHLISQSLRVL